MKKTAIVLNGDVCNVVEESFIIFADGGYNKVDYTNKDYIIVGDMDSVTKKYNNEKSFVVPTMKDFSDGLLAVNKAKELGFDSINIYGANGGRLDHIFANLSLLIEAEKLGLTAKITDNNTTIYYFNKDFNINTNSCDVVSIIPNNKCTINKASGFLYKLDDIKLDYENASYGISNVAVSNNCKVTIDSGSLFFFHNKNV